MTKGVAAGYKGGCAAGYKDRAYGLVRGRGMRLADPAQRV